ncbi:hypothetical protein ABBQ32_002156 [Trebouxia sp. C0010 RCD-2024]
MRQKCQGTAESDGRSVHTAESSVGLKSTKDLKKVDGLLGPIISKPMIQQGQVRRGHVGLQEQKGSQKVDGLLWPINSNPTI